MTRMVTITFIGRTGVATLQQVKLRGDYCDVIFHFTAGNGVYTLDDVSTNVVSTMLRNDLEYFANRDYDRDGGDSSRPLTQGEMDDLIKHQR